MRLVCRFWGVVNMSPFIDLRSDYPLILTLFEPAYPCAPTWSYTARPISARRISVPLTRGNHPAPGRIDIRFQSNYCSPERAPSARESAWALTPAPASVREIQLHADKQLMSPVENHRANLRGSTEFDSRESTASSSAKSAAFAVVEVTCCCGFHRRNSTKGSYYGSGALGGARLFAETLVKSDQIRRSTSCLKAEEP